MTVECFRCAALPPLKELMKAGSVVGQRSGVDFRPSPPRPVVYGKTIPSRRCATHRREDVKAAKARAHDTTSQRTYGVPAGWYAEQLRRQGGKCAFPRCRATGKAKRLAHDHDRAKAVTSGPGHPVAHAVDQACRYCVRGLLCQPHNYTFLGRFAGDLQDGLDYLADPPAQRWHWQEAG